MENTVQGQGVGGGRREPSLDPVKAQGIFDLLRCNQLRKKRQRKLYEPNSRREKTSVTKKEKHAARLWNQRWGFYTKIREIQEEEAQKIGLSVDEYRAALRTVSCKPTETLPINIEPSPKPLPLTSSGVIGHRALCSIDRYGPLVRTGRNYPTRPPLPPGQIYDPYKQTMIFLGGGIGDPISYKLPPARSEVTDEMWSRPQQLTVTQFNFNNINQ